MNSVIFCRRFLFSRFRNCFIYPSACLPQNGLVKYSNIRLLKSPTTICSLKFNQYYHAKFRTFNRGDHSSSKQEKNPEGSSSQNVKEPPPEKLSLFKRYRKMLKEYWYVLLPVHFVTSAFWFGGFYYAATCGIDIVPFLEYIKIPEKYINPLKNSSLGYIAVASAMYKLATPARYMVTLGGTTFAIKILVKRGLIRPAPTTKDEIKTTFKNIQNKLKKDPSDKQP